MYLPARPEGSTILTLLRQLTDESWTILESRDNLVNWIIITPVSKVLRSWGWKIHLSCSPHELEQCVAVVSPIMLRNRVAFKVTRDSKAATTLNSGLAGETQVGKIITAYPKDDTTTRNLILQLVRVYPRSSGPRLVSDLPMSASGHLGIRYGLFVRRKDTRDTVGRRIDLVTQSDGTTHKDLRTNDSTAPAWAPKPPTGIIIHPRHINKSKFRLATGSWRSLATIRENHKGLVCLAMRTSVPWDRAILKTARRGILLGTPEYDAVALLHREHDILTRLPIVDSYWPRSLDFSCDDDATLVQTDISGKMASEESDVAVTQKVDLILAAVAQLHANKVIHPDIKPTNIIIESQNRAFLVDFELASRHNHVNAPATGTPGFCNRNDLGDSSYFRDRFGLAATAYALFSQDNPCSLAPRLSCMHVVLRICGMLSESRFIKSLIFPRRDEPIVHGLASTIMPSFTVSYPRLVVSFRRNQSNRRWAKRSVATILCAIQEFRKEDRSTVHWTVDRAKNDSSQASLARGTCGIALALMSIRHLLKRNDFDDSILKSCAYLARQNNKQISSGLFTGKAGLSLCLAIAGKIYTEKKFSLVAKTLMEEAIAGVATDHDLYFGTAGILFAAIIMSALDASFELSVAKPAAKSLLSSHYVQDGISVWPNPGTLGKATTPYLGASHGSSGIAMVLACWGRAGDAPEASRLAADAMLSLFEQGRTSDKRQLRAQFEKGTSARSPNIWCHGVGGYLWCLLQSGLAYDCEGLAPALTWAARRLIDAPAVGNPTYCHGLSARLETLMMLSRAMPSLSVEADAASRVTVSVLRALSLRAKGAVHWSAEDASTITPELWTGLTGPLVAIARWEASRSDAFLSASWLVNIASTTETCHEI